MGLLNPGGPIAQFKRNRCSISPVELILQSGIRKMYYPDSIVNLHKKILKDAGLPHIRFHDLRHTFATLALQNGVDVKTVSSMLGHYDAGFTLRTYTHATRQKQDEAAQTMGNFMAQVM